MIDGEGLLLASIHKALILSKFLPFEGSAKTSLLVSMLLKILD